MKPPMPLGIAVHDDTNRRVGRHPAPDDARAGPHSVSTIMLGITTKCFHTTAKGFVINAEHAHVHASEATL